MSYLTYRSEHYVIMFLTAIFLYSLTCSVIAQDKYKITGLSNYKIKLYLSNLPEDVGKINQIPITNNDSQAGFKISGKKDENLLVSFLSDENNVSANKKSDSIAPLVNIPVLDAKKWDLALKSRYKDGIITSIAPGIKYIAIRRNAKAGRLFINVIEVNPALNPNLAIQPALAGITLPNARKITSIVKQNNAIAGINASYFKPSSGIPLGTLIIKDELITGPIYNRVTLGIKDNKFKMSKISLQGKLILPQGEEIKIDNVNQSRMLASSNIIYSYRWGKTAPASPKYGIQVAVDNGKVINISKDRLDIPVSGYVIAGPEKQLEHLKLNDSVQTVFSTNPDWSDIDHAISGGPYLIKDGQLYVDYKEQKLTAIAGRNPRTAVGYTADSRLILVTIDGRQKKSVGVSLYELAKIMKGFGCYNAMNFDGGSSTQMVVMGKVVNNPVNKGGNYVSNGLVIKTR